MARTKDFDEKEVLQKAVYLFWDKGFNGTSMQDLVDGLGISRSSLYDTFGDKYQLYLKALESYKNSHGNILATLDTASCSARVAVTQLLRTAANELLNSEQPLGCFMVNASTELASRDVRVNRLVSQTEKQLEEAFLKVIEKGQADGEISKDKDALTMARFLNNTVKGLQVSARSTGGRKFFEDIIGVAVTILD
ncbi:TetR/AcrR family transcriptional regulator [Pedobacter miscanthi]|uniref:TetR/AcrR family transcriptional regulator n=1 Tax=Pedobacter miscanthi TaxID=2259170 RepID=UPI00292E6920|nr:TetR/AcrR family transcriptional regulator [Pedobacter miscanthi]